MRDAVITEVPAPSVIVITPSAALATKLELASITAASAVATPDKEVLDAVTLKGAAPMVTV